MKNSNAIDQAWKSSRKRIQVPRDELPVDVRKVLPFKDLPVLATIAPLFDASPFFIKDGAVATAHLKQARQELFPLKLMGHLCGLMPLAANGPRKVWLFAFEGEGVGQIYECKLDSSTVSWAASSVQELYAKELRKGRPKRGKKDGLSPEVLWRRSLWLIRIINDSTMSSLSEDFKRAPGLKEFNNEKAHLGQCAGLALYWLFAHAFQGRMDEFNETVKLSSANRDPFVRSLRTLLTKWMHKKGVLGPVPKQSLDKRLKVVRKKASSRAGH